MNKKVFFIFLITIVALVLLFLFAFGPLANIRKSAQINPASIKPAAVNPVQVSNQIVSFNAYHNKDLTENYYGVQIPYGWTVQADQPGSYALTAANATGRVYLQDVSDNTTLELYILSQDEAQLKKSAVNYKRIDYRKPLINNNQAYQLVYQSTGNGVVYQTIKTYLPGTDHAGVVALSAPQNAFAQMAPIFEKITNSFAWENGK